MVITLEVFKGMAPKVEAALLPIENAQDAVNCRFISGGLRSWRNNVFILQPPEAGEKKTIFLHDGTYWFRWTEDVDIVKGAIANDAYKRLYFTGESFRPQMTTEELATTGGESYPVASYDLGIPAPENAPAVSLVTPTNGDVAVTRIELNTGGTGVKLNARNHGLNDTGYGVRLHDTGFATLDNISFVIEIVSSNELLLPKLTSFHNRNITAITRANPAVVTCTGHGLKTGDAIKFNVKDGMVQIDGREESVIVTDDNHFTVPVNAAGFTAFTVGNFELQATNISDAIKNISAITLADPAVVTSPAHGLKTGDTIEIAITAGMTQLDEWSGTVTYITANSFRLDGVDSTGYTAFVSGTFTRKAKLTPAPDPMLIESRSYLRTLVSRYGEEGISSAVSDIVDVLPGQQANLSWPLETAAANITKQRIYRTNTGSDATAYQLVAELDITATSYADTLKNAQLGEVLLSQEWELPPEGLRGLIALPNGSLCGFTGNLLCFTPPYRPHAWPVVYQYPLEFDIVGIGAFGTSVGVLTEGLPYVVPFGSDMGALVPEKMEVGFACSSKQGIVDLGYIVAYPAPVGLVLFGTGKMEVATEGIFSQEEWESLNPSSFHAYEYSGHYVCFYDNGDERRGFIYNITTNDFSWLDFYATAGFSRKVTGELFLVVYGNIVKFDAADSKMLYSWESKKLQVPRPTAITAGQVFADSYPVTVEVYGDGNLRATKSVQDSSPFRFSGGWKARTIEARIVGTERVNKVFLAESIKEISR